MTALDLSTLRDAEIAEFAGRFPEAAAWLQRRLDALEHARLAQSTRRTRYQEERYQALSVALQLG
jgi:hypothetical protein